MELSNKDMSFYTPSATPSGRPHPSPPPRQLAVLGRPVVVQKKRRWELALRLFLQQAVQQLQEAGVALLPARAQGAPCDLEGVGVVANDRKLCGRHPTPHLLPCQNRGARRSWDLALAVLVLIHFQEDGSQLAYSTKPAKVRCVSDSSLQPRKGK